MFRIVTDTSSNLPTAYLQAENITVIPFTFHTESGEQSCMDTAAFDAKAFYTAMRNGEKVTTSQIPPQRFVDYLHPMLEAGEDVLFVSMSSGISGSYASSKIAANQLQEEFPERKILTVDTYSASLAEGLVVMHAVECREKGMSIDETYTLLRALRHRIAQIFTVGDLRYLKRTAAFPIWRPPSERSCRSSLYSRATPRARSSASRRCAAGSARLRRWPSAMRHWLWSPKRRRSASRTPTASRTRRFWRTFFAGAQSRRRKF